MVGFRTALILLATAGALAAPALAQTPAQVLASAQPVRARPASTGPTSSGPALTGQPAAPPKITNSWVCASGIRLEVVPVSFDSPTDTPQYVLVFKRNNEIVASQRIDPAKVKDVPGYACDDRDDPKTKPRSELLG